MSRPNAFWDSSALVPLCTAQPQTNSARVLYEKYGIVAWWATEVEIRSALSRLRRLGATTSEQFLAAKSIAHRIVQGWLSVHESANITSDACALLEVHAVRAADAIQLAAALEACERNPSAYSFITGDQRQAEAARHIGFSVQFV